MRDYKFRGQRVDTKEWVYGYYAKAWDNTCYIITEFGPNVTCCSDCGINDMKVYEVIPETVGQYTGLQDKNGKEIYEGDIVRIKHGNGYQTFEEDVQVIWDEYGFSPMNWQYECDGCDIRCEILEIEISGNIHDNPDLLKAGD